MRNPFDTAEILKLHLECFLKAVLSSVTGGGVQFVVCDK